MGGEPLVGFHAEPRTEAEALWLSSALDEGELLIAWLAVTRVARPSGSPSTQIKSRWRFMVTTERASLVAFPTRGGELAPAELWPLPWDDEPSMKGTFGAATVSVGEWTFRTKGSNSWAFGDVLPLLPLSGRERRRAAARLNWIRRGGAEAPVRVAEALLEGSEDLLDQLALLVVRDRLSDGAAPGAEGEVEAVLQAVGRANGGGDALARWAREWQLTPDEQIELAGRLTACCGEGPEAEDAHRAALPLHRQARDALLPFEPDLAGRALLDIGLANHLLRAGEPDVAIRILEERRADLPDETLMDLLPPDDVDLTTEGTQALRIRLLELLVEARAARGEQDPASTKELARLQPLVASPLRALRVLAEGDLGLRARRLESLVSPAGLSEEEGAGGADELVDLAALSHADLEAGVKHPATEADGAFDRLNAWLGKAKGPDAKSIRAYAERATARSFPGLVGALVDASLVLGAPAVDAYISRGERGLGLRAYPGNPPFVLIGFQHLDEESEAYLRPPALLFAVAAEVAHVRFKHTRLTSSEVWDGAFQKGSSLLDFVGAFSGPLGFLGRAAASLRRLAAVQAVLRHAQAVTSGASKAREVVGYASGIRKKATKASKRVVTTDLEIGQRESELLAACRLLQLTADRAGLVVSGDPRAATEAIFLTSGDYRSELELARRHGLPTALGRRGPEGQLINQHLALRLAALYSFYLSDDYERLRAAAVVH